MRPRKSVEEKLLAGTYRRDRESPPDLSTPLVKLPPSPSRLSKAGKAAWRRVGQAAIEIGSLRHSDLPQLELLASALALAEECELRIRVAGLTVTSSTGVTKANPVVSTMQIARGQAHRIMQHLGLSPTGRIRLGAKRPPELAPMKFPAVIEGGKQAQTLREFLAEGDAQHAEDMRKYSEFHGKDKK
jgi:P27 family predicted phage terminase small subunit